MKHVYPCGPTLFDSETTSENEEEEQSNVDVKNKNCCNN